MPPFTREDAHQSLAIDCEKPWYSSRGPTYVRAEGTPAKGLSAAVDLSSAGEADVFTLSLSCSILHAIIQYELDH